MAKLGAYMVRDFEEQLASFRYSARHQCDMALLKQLGNTGRIPIMEILYRSLMLSLSTMYSDVGIESD